VNVITVGDETVCERNYSGHWCCRTYYQDWRKQRKGKKETWKWLGTGAARAKEASARPPPNGRYQRRPSPPKNDRRPPPLGTTATNTSEMEEKCEWVENENEKRIRLGIAFSLDTTTTERPPPTSTTAAKERPTTTTCGHHRDGHDWEGRELRCVGRNWKWEED